VLLDDLVDFLHEADGFFERDDDFLVVGEIPRRKHAAGARIFAAFGLAIFQPFFAHLVAADVEVPDLLRQIARV